MGSGLIRRVTEQLWLGYRSRDVPALLRNELAEAVRIERGKHKSSQASSNNSSSLPLVPAVMVSACLMGHKVTFRGGSSRQKDTHPIRFIEDVLASPLSPLPFEEGCLSTTLCADQPILRLQAYCPEVSLLNLPVPRPPMRLWSPNRVLINSNTLHPIPIEDAADVGQEVTLSNQSHVARNVQRDYESSVVSSHSVSSLPPLKQRAAITMCEPFSGFILKARSPSCGVGDARVYASKEGGEFASTDGFFARDVVAPSRREQCDDGELSKNGSAAIRPDVVTERTLRDDKVLLDFLEYVFAH